MVSLCEELQKLSLSILSVYNLLQFEVAIVAQLQEGTVLQTHLEQFPYPAMCQFVGISATDNQGAHGDLIKQSFHSFCGARYLPSQDALGAAGRGKGKIIRRKKVKCQVFKYPSQVIFFF